ncbi:dioxygenase family protein [Nitrospira sp. Ecomares 2.1]
MTIEPHRLSRRTLLKRGMGIFGLLAGGFSGASSLAEILKEPTPRQTLGPFFPDEGDPIDAIRENHAIGIPISQANDQDLTFVKGRRGKAKGQVIYLKGKVLSAKSGKPIPHTAIIMWSASASGRYNHREDNGMLKFPHPTTGEIIHRTYDAYFQYWGQAVTNEQGDYWFKTIVPGFYPIDLEAGLYRPSHLHFQLVPPGHPKLVTQLYFRGDQIPNNELNQKLLPMDVVILDAGLTTIDLERVIVDYAPDTSGEMSDGLVGRYDFMVPN